MQGESLTVAGSSDILVLGVGRRAGQTLNLSRACPAQGLSVNRLVYALLAYGRSMRQQDDGYLRGGHLNSGKLLER